jgi:hypothetical protein
MIHLKKAADGIEQKFTFEGMYTAYLCRKWLLTAFTAIRQTLFSDTKGQLQSAELLPERRYHKYGAKIILELLKKGSISEDTFYGLVGADIGDKLLETNAFAFHFNSREVTFQSTTMKRFCEENSALWEGK